METTEKKKCKSCKKFTSYHWSLVAISFYILFAAVYGTIKLVNEISQLF
jgi:NO-binding membrane sensor protein with MHYT domain